MGASQKAVNLSAGQQRLLKLLFKFRFLSTHLLATIMGINRRSAYEAIEQLVAKDYVAKVYSKDFRYAKKPAYYYLTKLGATTVGKTLGVKETTIHALYGNDRVTSGFIEHCLLLAGCYVALAHSLSSDTDIFTKAEINRFNQFPKNRPDFYIRSPDGNEAIIILVDTQPAYIVRKRLNEIITHSEEEGWEGEYPTICFILPTPAGMASFLYTTNKKLEGMGIDEDELTVLAAAMTALDDSSGRYWASAFEPKKRRALFSQE